MKLTVHVIYAAALLAVNAGFASAQCIDGCPKEFENIDQCWFCEDKNDCVESGGCEADDPDCCCVAYHVNYCGKPNCNDFTKCVAERERDTYYMIKGTSQRSGTELCWEVRGGNPQEGNKIVLGNCQSEDKNLFELNAFVTEDGQDSASFRPKVNKRLIVGVREPLDSPDFDGRAWLRIEEPHAILDGTQHFVRTEEGLVTVDSFQNLFVTNQGANTEVGDPVMLKFLDRIRGDSIKQWDLIEVQV